MDIRALVDTAKARGVEFKIEGDRIKVEARTQPDNDTKGAAGDAPRPTRPTPAGTHIAGLLELRGHDGEKLRTSPANPYGCVGRSAMSA